VAIPVRKVVLGFIVANAVTFPLATLLSLRIGFVAEAIPLALEPFVFARYSGYSLKQSWRAVVVSNVASFLVGVGLAYLWLHLLGLPEELTFS
jgi:hypothetical protein